jgi:CRISPR/Cas system CSM-associated protein Csm3 (group 7 of RAMP superfamily)
MEVLPKGTEFDLRLELEDANENDERLLAVALAEWHAGRAWIGGRAARGLGAFDLTGVKFVEWELSSAEGLMGFLKADAPWTGATQQAGWLDARLNEARKMVQGRTAHYEGVARSFVTLRFDLKIQGPFLTNDTTAAVQSGFDSVPLLDVVGTNGKPILPGASLRGVLRSHAERIARTLATLEAADPGDFLAKCPACNPVESGDENAALANCDTLLRKIAKISDEDEVTDDQLCLACRLFGSTRLGSRLIVEDAEADANTLRKVLDFLAIDRFTGGGKEGAKFDALALWQPTFSVPLHLENPAVWELGWLMLVLRDMQDEMLTVGFGGVKGFGRARLESLTMHYGFISDDDFPVVGSGNLISEYPLHDCGLYRVITWDTRDNAQRERLGTLAQSWVDEFNKTWKELKRPPDLHLKKDTYFDGDVPKLYEKEAYQCLLKP